jgi:hypothetical protein
VAEEPKKKAKLCFAKGDVGISEHRRNGNSETAQDQQNRTAVDKDQKKSARASQAHPQVNGDLGPSEGESDQVSQEFHDRMESKLDRSFADAGSDMVSHQIGVRLLPFGPFSERIAVSLRVQWLQISFSSSQFLPI